MKVEEIINSPWNFIIIKILYQIYTSPSIILSLLVDNKIMKE